MQKKFEINRTKIKGGCQSGRKVVTHNSKSDLLLASYVHVLRYFGAFLELGLLIFINFVCNHSSAHRMRANNAL